MTTRAEAGRRQGVLADWNDDRGFGFITPEGGGPRTFAHISVFPRGGRPRPGLMVTYTASYDERNRPHASAVQYVGRAPRPRRPGLVPAGSAAGVFLLAVLVLGLAGRVPLWLPVVYVSLSLVALLTYRSDKAAAEAGRWRTPEATLHLQALLGGWPGALVARHLYHHKTTKQPFVTFFWVTVPANVAVLAWVALGMPTAIV